MTPLFGNDPEDISVEEIEEWSDSILDDWEPDDPHSRKPASRLNLEPTVEEPSSDDS